MTFNFKEKSHDFFVSENLPFKFTGKGDVFYVYFEKRNITTYDVLDHLRRNLGLSRMSLGIAGLKDKKAIAKQWISIYDRALKKAGGERAFTDSLSEIVTILETERHSTPLNMSTPITNSFHIKLRSTKNLWQQEKVMAKEIVESLLKGWYPNLFGDQRFGINGRNASQGREIMTGNQKKKEQFTKGEATFKLQAYASKIFNEYATKRSKNKKVLDGDIVTRREDRYLKYGVYNAENKTVRVCPVKWENKDFFFFPVGEGKEIPYVERKMIVTWPVPGYNTPLAAIDTPAGKAEMALLEKNELTAESMEVYQQYLVYGLRRPLWVYPTKTNARYIQDDMLIDFTLTSWSYASIVVDSLLEELG